MVQGMSRVTWDEFSKTILVRCLIISLWNPFFVDPSVSLEWIFAFSVGVF